MVKEKLNPNSEANECLTDIKDLVVHNDEVNTFDYVIKTLVEVCNHEPEQAEQCTLIIHFNGKCTVKSGDFSSLKPLCDSINNRGISATIE